jgi:O-antigen/teichoic acid export membrane protein
MALNAALSWTMLTMALQTILRMGGNIALTHILLPHDFGLAAIVFAVIFGIEMMTDGGAMVSLMRSKRTDDAWLDTVWTFEVCRSLLIATVAVIIAHPVALIFKEPQLTPMMMFIGLVPVCSALTSTSKYMALRNLSLKRYSIAEVAVVIISYAVSLPVAWYTGSAWALLLGGVAYVALLSLSSYFIFPYRRHRLRFERAALKELLGFGLWLTLTSAIAFVIVQGDKFIIGKALGVSALGVYSVAAAWSGALTDVAVRFVMRIFIPVFSAMYREDGHTDRIRRLRINMLLSGMVPVAAFSGLGYPLVHFVYPDTMSGAAPVLGVLVIGVWFAVLDTLYHHQFLAEGKSDRRIYAQIVSLLFLAVALALTWSNLTTFSLTAIFVAGIAVRTAVMAAMAYTGNLRSGFPDLALTLMFLALAYLSSYTAYWFSLMTSDLGVMFLQVAAMSLPAIVIGYYALKRSNLLMTNLIQT